jgi:subtilisin family serine protease
LRAVNPQVVNISQTFDEDVADCEAFFGPVFDEFRERVLFIVGAGNSGDRNPQTVCPGSLGHKYPNVVSVAGVDDGGEIHWSSNYGAEVVQLAAPFCTAVLGKNGAAETSPSKDCGTSFSAPLVANAALRVLADNPKMKPSEIRDLLLQSCSDEGLDVACGGVLDAGKLRSNLAAIHERQRSARIGSSSAHPHPAGPRLPAHPFPQRKEH